MLNYNLLEQEWIPVLYRDGIRKRVNILEAFAQANRIREVAASNPMDRVAVLRFLLALLYWCKGNPPDAKDSLSSFPPDWFEKLDDNKDCFSLLGDGKRFYQCKSKSGKERRLSANYLMQEVPTGTNVRHFRHCTDYKDGLCPACCALGLLRLPAFATQGGQGKSPGINQKPPVYVLPLGTSLTETLGLLWRARPDLDFGTPAWEKADVALPESGNVPLLVGLTWLPRRVWLDDPTEPADTCIVCGHKGRLIRQSVFAGLGSAKTGGAGAARVWRDPHTLGEDDKVLKPSDALGAPDAAAGKWAQVVSGILTGKEPPEQARLWVVGFATDQNKYLEAKEEEIRLVGGLEEETVRQGLERIDRWQREVWKLVPRAKPREPGRKVKHVEILPAIAAIRPQAEGNVSATIGELLLKGDDAWERAARKYSPMMAAVAKSLSPGVTTAALRRRREIEYLKPDMRPKAPEGVNAERKKGGTNDSNGTVRQSLDADEIW